MSFERYKCDRNGGVPADYLLAPRRWDCPRCGRESNWRGHRCHDCGRRICCDCLHHDMACCLDMPGSDCADQGPAVVESCVAASQRKGRS